MQLSTIAMHTIYVSGQLTAVGGSKISTRLSSNISSSSGRSESHIAATTVQFCITVSSFPSRLIPSCRNSVTSWCAGRAIPRGTRPGNWTVITCSTSDAVSELFSLTLNSFCVSGFIAITVPVYPVALNAA